MTLRSIFNTIMDFDLTWLLGLVILLFAISVFRLLRIMFGQDIYAFFHFDLARLWRKSP